MSFAVACFKNFSLQGLDKTDIADLEDTLYLRRLDGGLYTLQTVDYILAWIIMEDDGVRLLARIHSLREC